MNHWDFDDNSCSIDTMVAQDSVKKLDQYLASSAATGSSGSFNKMLVFRQICFAGSQKLYDAMIERGYTPDEVCLNNSIGWPWFYDILKRVSPGKDTLLFAVEHQKVDNVKALLAYGVDVDSRESTFGFTPMAMAVKKKNDTIIQLLLQAGAPRYEL